MIMTHRELNNHVETSLYMNQNIFYDIINNNNNNNNNNTGNSQKHTLLNSSQIEN